ncbi:MAG TPA: hypothetical protein PLV05_10005 [Verrucomicrobiota bacterium]|nr:hypothetical protein [Verrucomicrobiota bacterium]HRR65013.1 hypothetical protein [Candidatus Paceibacterota bacterium]HOF71160.1 hypothetical protein [Verrucomicrobiota bacterium]HOM45716.1 hypothetical protein [Verrucomicrobiota bacterium]HOQ56072.1 hypothetical protein [Verrucomicrobiota bacterium]
MSNASALFRSLIVYGLCLPLAVALGYLLANPLDLTTVVVVGSLCFILMIPIFLRWHHVWLIAAWNMSAVVFFLPGRPPLWMALAAISFSIGVLQYTINRNMRFLHVPSVTWPLLFLSLVVLITMRLTGGFGLRSLGSDTYGGRNYIMFFATIIGYFALISRPIPPKRALLYVALFFLGTSTMAIGDLPMLLPSSFNFVYLVFPLLGAGWAALQGATFEGPVRITGFAFFNQGIFTAMLALYGIRGIFAGTAKSWRAVLFAACVFGALMGGFRSIVILFFFTFAILFYMERLHHTRLLPTFIFIGLLGGALMITFAHRMPHAVQRSLAFLPVKLDPEARLSAAVSAEWRLKMWQELLPQIPQYLILGQGYAFSGQELNLLHDTRSGESSKLVGNYHNGPLSVLIPFGSFGMLGFLWFLWAGLRVLYLNYQFGDPAYRTANNFLFAYFLVKAVFFFVIFGAFISDMLMFVGMLGLSISLNGGVAKPALAPQPQVVVDRFKLRPGSRRPVSA